MESDFHHLECNLDIGDTHRCDPFRESLDEAIQGATLVLALMIVQASVPSIAAILFLWVLVTPVIRRLHDTLLQLIDQDIHPFVAKVLHTFVAIPIILSLTFMVTQSTHGIMTKMIAELVGTVLGFIVLELVFWTPESKNWYALDSKGELDEPLTTFDQ